MNSKKRTLKTVHDKMRESLVNIQKEMGALLDCKEHEGLEKADMARFEAERKVLETRRERLSRGKNDVLTATERSSAD